jgi:murein DD-endopeptidase MepM/ murein hydrolase activator NlpD
MARSFRLAPGWRAALALMVVAGCAKPLATLPPPPPAPPPPVSAPVPELERVQILAAFGTRGSSGGRHWVHAGVDYVGRPGDPVLAGADGVVFQRVTSNPCGRGLIIEHPTWHRYTLYCHLRRWMVDEHQRVVRGAVVGLVGDSGNTRGRPHVHLELWKALPPRSATLAHDAIPDHVLDPHSVIAGCFDPARTYPTGRFTLTYPLRCAPP